MTHCPTSRCLCFSFSSASRFPNSFVANLLSETSKNDANWFRIWPATVMSYDDATDSRDDILLARPAFSVPSTSRPSQVDDVARPPWQHWLRLPAVSLPSVRLQWRLDCGTVNRCKELTSLAVLPSVVIAADSRLHRRHRCDVTLSTVHRPIFFGHELADWILVATINGRHDLYRHKMLCRCVLFLNYGAAAAAAAAAAAEAFAG